MRVLAGKFTEIDLHESDAKEKMRSSPILDAKLFDELWQKVPVDAERAIKEEDV